MLILHIIAIPFLLRQCVAADLRDFVESHKSLSKYPSQTYLKNVAGDDQLSLSWSKDDKYIAMAVVTPIVGWLGIGITEMGGMEGSDLWIYETSQPDRMLDTHATAFARPDIDDSQDVTLTNVVTTDEFMVIEFQRLLDTGDDAMDWKIIDDRDRVFPATKLIATWGDSSSMEYHNFENRLQAPVRFFGDENNSKVHHENDVNHFFKDAEGSILLQVTQLKISPRWTTKYEHRCFTFDDLVQQQNLPHDTPVHLLGFEWLIDPKVHAYVHHIALYSSTKPTISQCDQFGPHHFMSVFSKTDDRPLYVFPNDVGMLLADGSTEPTPSLGRIPRSFRLEVHYENPKGVKGVFDRGSGVRLHYTTKLRPHSAAILELGDPRTKLMLQPVGEGLQQHTFECPTSCTQALVPKKGIQVVYEMLHMHQTGLSMENIHYRDGQEIRRGVVEYYDFNQGQQFVRQDPFSVLPGDSFSTSCYYRGENDTQFGFKSSDEMCMGWLLYYPATAIHLSCGYKADEKRCRADHSSKAIKEDELPRTFGIPLHSGPRMQYTNTLLACAVGALAIMYLAVLLYRMWSNRMRLEDEEVVSLVQKRSASVCDFNQYGHGTIRQRRK